MRKTSITIELVHDDLVEATEFYLEEIAPLLKRNKESVSGVTLQLEPEEQAKETVQ